MSPCYGLKLMHERAQPVPAKVEKAGAGDLILPLMMIDPSATRGADDRILGKLKGFQYKDISSMRFMDRGSGEYSKAINALAQGILKAQRALESAALRDIAPSVVSLLSVKVHATMMLALSLTPLTAFRQRLTPC